MINLLSMLVFKNTAEVKLAGGLFIQPANKGMNIIKYYVRKDKVTLFYIRSEGEKVRVGDDLILVSVATERYLVSSHIKTETLNLMVILLLCSIQQKKMNYPSSTQVSKSRTGLSSRMVLVFQK